MLRIEIAAVALRQLRRLPNKHSNQITAKLYMLQHDPQPNDSQQLKGKLKEWRRVDSGEYRIIYRIEDETLKIAAIGHRNDYKVYRDFQRKL